MASDKRTVAHIAEPKDPALLALTKRAFGMLLALTVLTGAVYPLVVTAIAMALFAEEANGSLIVKEGTIVGSRLIGQPFAEPKHFWGRLSATGPAAYNAGASTGSNLGPTNPDLAKKAAARIEALRALDPGNDAPVPVDLVTSSASGLDPHISLAAAEYQVRRVARARGLSEETVRASVRGRTTMRDLGVLGEPAVNVLLLNLDLDRHESR